MLSLYRAGRKRGDNGMRGVVCFHSACFFSLYKNGPQTIIAETKVEMGYMGITLVLKGIITQGYSKVVAYKL